MATKNKSKKPADKPTKKQIKADAIKRFRDEQFMHYMGYRSYKEGRKEIKARFEEDARRFHMSEGNVQDEWCACDYWEKYPYWACLMGTDEGWDDDTYAALHQVYWEAVNLVMRAAERENLNSYVIGQCAMLQREIIDADPEKYYDVDVVGPELLVWPECLGEYRWEFLAEEQRILREAEEIFTRLRMKLEVKLRAEGRWHGAARYDKESGEEKPSVNTLGNNDWLSARGFAIYLKLPRRKADALRKALMKYKDDKDDEEDKSWKKDSKKVPGDSQFTFRVGGVRNIVKRYVK